MSFVFNPFTINLDRVNPSSGGPSSIWDSITANISASSTGVIDTVGNGSFKSLKYIVSVFNGANNSFKTLEIDILNEGSTYKETVFGRLRSGSSDIEVTTVNNAGSMELRLTNNESFDLTVSAGRLVLN
jgi:hypothetical protein